MFLFLNTANYEHIELVLINNQGEILELKKIPAKFQQSEKLLPNIAKLVGKKLKELKGIIAVTGPGSFTGLRIGLTTANVLAWSLQIPIIGIKLDDKLNPKELIQKGVKSLKNKNKFNKPVLPFYGQEPNITIKK